MKHNQIETDKKYNLTDQASTLQHIKINFILLLTSLSQKYLTKLTF